MQCASRPNSTSSPPFALSFEFSQAERQIWNPEVFNFSMIPIVFSPACKNLGYDKEHPNELLQALLAHSGQDALPPQLPPCLLDLMMQAAQADASKAGRVMLAQQAER